MSNRSAARGTAASSGQLHQVDAAAETVEAVIALMRSAVTRQSLAEIAPEWKDEMRAYANACLVALGWPSKQAA